jgi:hypothetical protein
VELDDVIKNKNPLPHRALIAVVRMILEKFEPVSGAVGFDSASLEAPDFNISQDVFGGAEFVFAPVRNYSSWAVIFGRVIRRERVKYAVYCSAGFAHQCPTETLIAGMSARGEVVSKPEDPGEGLEGGEYGVLHAVFEIAYAIRAKKDPFVAALELENFDFCVIYFVNMFKAYHTVRWILFICRFCSLTNA